MHNCTGRGGKKSINLRRKKEVDGRENENIRLLTISLTNSKTIHTEEKNHIGNLQKK